MKPNGDTAVLELLDNGIGADATKDDGVYSKFFAYPNQQGRYTVKCQVKSNHNTFEILGFIGSASPQLFGIINSFWHTFSLFTLTNPSCN